MPTVTVSGTELYYEIRGTGPPVLLIMGSTGDGAHFDALADLLADAVERFWCYMAGDDGWNRLAPALRERLHATASTLFGVELGTYELYLPDDEALATIAAPVRLLVSEDGLPVFAEIAARFGKRLGVGIATTPGTHATYHEHPYELAEIIRPFLREVSAVAT
jgi:pimeloyl-ACP methyl ester carboxylesterase